MSFIRGENMRIRSVSGVTLVETMASVLLFALVLGAILNVAIQNMTMGKRSEYAYSAYNLAKNHLETLKAMPFSTLANAAETDTYLDATGTPNADGPFIRNTSITTSYTGDPDLVEVQVSVNYILRGSTRGDPTLLTTVVYQYT